MDLSYLGTLSVVNALLIGQVEEDGVFSVFSDPPSLAFAVRVFHSMIFWSQFYSLLLALLSIYLSLLYGHQKVHTTLPTVFFAAGIILFILYGFIIVVQDSFGLELKHLPPPEYRPGLFVCYVLPQIAFFMLFVLSVAFLYRSVRSDAHPITLSQWYNE